MKRSVKIASLLLAVSVLFSGCSSTPEEVREAGELIELLPPVTAGECIEKTARRTLYESATYSAGVYPYVEEYSFSESLSVSGYPFVPGDKVSAGDIICYGDTKSIDEQIENAEKGISDLKESFDDYYDDAAIRLSTLQKERSGIESEKGKESLEYKLKSNEISKLSDEMSNKKAIYETDRKYSEKKLEDLNEAREKYIVRSEIDGEVVSIKSFDYNSSYVSANHSVIAVADLSRRKVLCEYINKTTVRKAADIYALVNGKRYEVEYQPMDSNTYAQLSSEGTVYSEFLLTGDISDIKPGDYAVIVLVSKKYENVLTVQRDSIAKDSTGYYVLIQKEGGNEHRTVKTGYSDGTYTEIVSGLSEGEEVIIKEPLSTGSGTAVTTVGGVSNSFTGNGYMYFPSGIVVENPVEYATVYFTEYHVQQYEEVDENTVIATVRTVGDEMEKKRTETNLKRLKERLSDIQNQSTEGWSDAQKASRKKNIEAQKEQIEKVQEKLEKINEDFETTQILAGKKGIVISLQGFSEEQIIRPGQAIAEIADVNNCYVVVDDTKGQLNYGNEVSIEYTSKSKGIPMTAKGTVVMLNNAALSRDLRLDQMIIRVDPEALSDMTLTSVNDGGWWNRTTYRVDATIREMNNVVLVPREAVTDKAGKTYVNVLMDNGDVVATPFIPGGSNSLNYWVAEGLTEGTVVCLK